MRRPPPWIALVPLAAAAALLGVAIAEGLDARRPGEAPWVHPAEVELDAFPAWADPRWRVAIEALLDATPPFRADDAAAVGALQAELEALAFASAVDRPAVDRAGGLRLGLRLRRPAAAVPVHAGYLTVDRAGVLLPGAWPAPPRRGELWLPVLLPDLPGDAERPEEERFAFDLAVPGDWLAEPAHVAALDVALSLAEHLAPDEAARLGRVAIDGSGFAVRGPEDAGVVLVREDGRRIAFGRPPSAGAPGELPAERKWRAVVAALDLLDDPAETGGEGAWDVCDVRWDVPELRLVGDAAEAVAARIAPRAEGSAVALPASWSTQSTDAWSSGAGAPVRPRPAPGGGTARRSGAGPPPRSGPDAGAGAAEPSDSDRPDRGSDRPRGRVL